MRVTEFISQEAGPASKKLCKSKKPDPLGAYHWHHAKLGGSRKTMEKSYKIGKKRVYVAGKKIKGKPYGGPLPLYK